MKYAISIVHNETHYNSEITELSDEEKVNLEQLIIKSAEGKLTYFAMKRENRTYYFPQNILKDSVISILEIKD